MQIITANQMRAARALLGWSQQDLADKAEMNVKTISKYEVKGTQHAVILTIDKIVSVFIANGIRFDANGGVRRDG